MPRQSPGLAVRDAVRVFAIFLRLGLTSFGGPVAHLAYFRAEFVARRRWLGEADYAHLVALCQALPGPASSQVGMALGHLRAGGPGLVAAWLGFTLPSAVAMAGLALVLGTTAAGGMPGWLVGVKAAVVGVVAHAVLGMARTLARGGRHGALALAAAGLALGLPGLPGQVLALGLAAVIGACRLRPVGAFPAATQARPWRAARTHGRGPGLGLLAFGGLLAGLPALALATQAPLLDLLARCYRAGALVFGGGHVVLPLLNAEVVAPGLVSPADFLAGYGAVQAMPGPLFTVAAWLGAVARVGPEAAPGGWLGAGVAILGIFLPSLCLVTGIWPWWRRLAGHPPVGLGGALAGVNAAVVGLLTAALVDPVLPAGVTGPGTALLALVSLGALASDRVPAWLVVPVAALVGHAVY